MIKPSDLAIRWNIFARELEVILAVRQLRIEALPEEIALFPGKVRRLAQSLSEPDSFPILTDEEITALTRKFNLNNDEVLRLHAAILAASIEQSLMVQMDKEAARSIAEAAFQQILSALRQADDEANDPDTTRGDIFLGMDDANERALNAAWRSFDARIKSSVRRR